MMIRSEAKRQLVAAFPGRSVCVVIEDWHHAATETPDRIGYRVSVLPGLDGSKCSTVSDISLAGAVEKALAMKRIYETPTEEEADRHFAEDDTFVVAELVPSI